MSAKVKKISLRSVLSDKSSGSTELLSNLNKYFLSIAHHPDKMRDAILIVNNELKDFAAITNYTKRLKNILNKNNPELIVNFLQEFFVEEANKFDRLYKKCFRLLSECENILTLSNSKTLLEIFTRLNIEVNNFKVIICESGPGNEGIIFAKLLAESGIKVKIIPDSAMSLFIQKCDAVVIGADMILKSGKVVNKIGSQNAAVICNYYKIPFYVVSTKEKLTNQTNLKAFKKKSDPLFEEVDKELITRIITD